jgi:phage terminase small subunit
MKGRKPLPTAVKIVKQVRSHRINYLEPKLPEEVDLSPPDYFDDCPFGYARIHWEAVVPALAKAGLVTVVDRPALEALCLNYAIWREDPHNTKAFGEWRKIAQEFGMTPSSRSRIKVTGPQADELDLFLGSAG